MSQKQIRSQDIEESQDHDALPEAFLDDTFSQGETLKLLIKMGLATAPEAQQTAAGFDSSSVPAGGTAPTRGTAQGYRGSRGGRSSRGYSTRGRGGDPSQQRQRSMVEELSTVSASQTQIRDMSGELASLGQICKSNAESIKTMSVRMDSMSTRNTRDMANMRRSLTTLAADFVDLKNLVALMYQRGTGESRATYPTMTAGELATMTLETGKKVTGKEEVTLKGAGVPSKALRISGDVEATGGSVADQKPLQSAQKLKGGILMTKGEIQSAKTPSKAVPAIRPPRPSIGTTSAPAASSAQRPTVIEQKKPVALLDQVRKSIRGNVERFGPTSVQSKSDKGKEKDLIDLQGSWDDQVTAEENEEECADDEEEYAEDEEGLYADYSAPDEDSGFTFQME